MRRTQVNPMRLTVLKDGVRLGEVEAENTFAATLIQLPLVAAGLEVRVEELAPALAEVIALPLTPCEEN